MEYLQIMIARITTLMQKIGLNSSPLSSPLVLVTDKTKEDGSSSQIMLGICYILRAVATHDSLRLRLVAGGVLQVLLAVCIAPCCEVE